MWTTEREQAWMNENNKKLNKFNNSSIPLFPIEALLLPVCEGVCVCEFCTSSHMHWKKSVE